MTNCLHTGGSVGGDIFWETLAKKNGHWIKEYRFDGHKNTRLQVYSPPNWVGHHEDLEITSPDIQLCNAELELVAKNLESDLPITGYHRHLLERDWILVNKSHAQTLYAVGHFEKYTRFHDIEGGTGWIIELFKLRNLPMFFRCIESGINYKYTSTGWVQTPTFPTPTGNWIGVGSRKL